MKKRALAEEPGQASIDPSVARTSTVRGRHRQEKPAANLLSCNRRSFINIFAAFAAFGTKAFAAQKVAAPTFNPPASAYSSAQNVTISTTTSGASIRYTTDGSTPTPAYGTLYSGPVSISVTTTLKAIAYMSGMRNSNVTTGVYTITDGSVYSDTYSDIY
jgi:Chitobiase/beta-hexosaminidase C-terminal domain